MAQQPATGHNCNGCPHHNQRVSYDKLDPKAPPKRPAKKDATKGCDGQKCDKNAIAAEITAAFPAAKYVKREGVKQIIFDAKKNQIGYVVYSKPASDGIKGYAGETPLMVALDMKDRVIGITLLENSETPGYLNKVLQSGLLKSWDGMKARKAAKKKVDTVSGATYSSRSIIETLQAALKQIL